MKQTQERLFRKSNRFVGFFSFFLLAYRVLLDDYSYRAMKWPIRYVKTDFLKCVYSNNASYVLGYALGVQLLPHHFNFIVRQ